jgi:uncharacterized membrane protein
MAEGPEIDDVRRELRDLKARVDRLESEKVISRSLESPSPLAAPLSGTASVEAPQVFAPTTHPQQKQSLEQRIGSQLFNRVGILAVLFAVAWFLKLAIDRDWIGPGLRIAVGLLIAAFLMGWSERFRARHFTAFSYTLKALGSGIGYLTLWASLNIYHLFPAWLAFVLMVVVTVTNALFALKQESELLAGYALLGGLVTPALLSTAEDNEVFLFGYLLVLAIGVVPLFGLRSWLRLGIAAFAGISLYFFSWYARFYHPGQRSTTLFFVALFFAVFSATPFLLLRRAQPVLGLSVVRKFVVAAPVAISAVAAFEAFPLVSDVRSEWMRVWLALAFAMGALLLSQLATRRLSDGLGRELSATQEAIATLFLAMAIGFAGTGYGITLGWLGEAMGIVVLACVRPRLTRRSMAAGMLALCLASLLLLEFSDPLRQPVEVFLNFHFLVYLVGIGVFAATIWMSLAARRRDSADMGKGNWTTLIVLSTVALNLVALLAVSLEIHHYWSCGARLSGNLCRVVDPRDIVFAHFVYSGWFMLYAAALMTAGFLAGSAFVRWQAVVLLTLSIAKVFLVDTSQLNQGFRVLSFLTLGVMLLVISFAYQRDWLALRRK